MASRCRVEPAEPRPSRTPVSVARRAAILLAGLLAIPDPALAQSAPPRRMFGSDDAPPPGPPAPRIVVRLRYVRGPGAEACPDSQVFRDAVGAQVKGRDPFAPDAPLDLVVTLARQGRGFEGSAELRDASGIRWTRPFSATPTCMGLVEDLAFAVASKIDPRAPAPNAGNAPALSSPSSPSPPSHPVARLEAPVPAPVARTPLAFRVGASTWMGLASAPRPAFGVSADAGLRVSWFSLTMEARWDPPAGAEATKGVEISTARLMGALVPCGHVAWFVACIAGELGQVQATLTAAGGASPEQRAALYAAAGGRLGLEIEVAPHLSFRAAVNLLGAVQRPRVRLDQKNQWEGPAFLGGPGAGLVASF